MADSKPSFFRRYAFLFTAAAGTVLTVSGYLVIDRAAVRHLETEFFRRADIRHTLTREILNYYEASLFSLRLLYLDTGEVARAEFDRAAAEIVARYPGISALEWAPVVSAAQRAAFETAATAELGRPVQIIGRAADGAFRRAEPKLEYAPVSYIHPAAGREGAFGFDITAGRISASVARARAERRMIVSPASPLIEEPNRNRVGVVWIWPIFRHRDATTPTGYLLGVFRIPEMLNETLRRHSVTVLEALYVDPTEPDPARRVFHYQSGRSTAPNVPWPTEAEFRRNPLVREQPLPIGGRIWQVLYRPQAHWADELTNPLPALLLTGGLLLTAVFSGWVFQQSRRAAVVERLVLERTTELTESQRKLDSFLHALPGMAYRGTYDEQFDITFISDGATALTGHEPAEFLSRRLHLRDLIHPDDVARVRSATRAALAAGNEVEIEYRIRPRAGGEKWVLSRGRAVRTDGGPAVFEGLAIDITAQKKTEAERLALERKLLEGQKLESLGLLAGGIAHDFNNLLTGVLGNASLARHTLAPGSPLEPQMRAIEHAALRAADLCRQMLAYAGKGRFVVEPVDLTLLAEGMLPLLHTSIALRAGLQLEVARDLPAVMADATQLRQIVMNLVLNAADAIGDGGGTITLATGLIRADAAYLAGGVVGADISPGDYVFLEVRDTGCGMAPEVLARIFDPFFTTKFAGRGLGLAAALGIVRAHHGAMRVASTPGRGSSFRLLLPPTVERGALPAASTPPALSWHRPGHVLVIEDEEPVRLVAAALLKSLGLTPRVTANGPAGLAAFREEPAHYDLVLLDLMMPAMSGEETLAALREIRPAVRVLIMSGYAEGDLLRRCASERSPLAFLPKPFNGETLAAKLRELLG